MRLPILSVHGDQATALTRTSIRALGKNEDYLHELIEKAPELLGLESPRSGVKGPYAHFHKRELDAPSGQTIEPDIVFLTESGHVVVVEVKLSDNPDLLRPRMVLAQVIEYAASLARYDEAALVQLFEPELPEGARFSDVVRKHFPEAKEPVLLGAELVRKIQAAELHLVVACDEAPEGLREFVAAVTAQEALGAYELRVCELVPYVDTKDAEAGVFLVPSAILRTEVVARTEVVVTAGPDGRPSVSARVTPQDEVQANLAAAAGRPARVPHPQIVGAEAAYSRMAEPGTSTTGRAPDFRFVTVDGWPGDIHYEFLHRKTKNEFGAELHFESDKDRARRASNAVRDARLKPTGDLPGLVWDQAWAKGKGRLRVVFPSDTDPEILARTMVALVRKTRAIVDKALKA